MRTDDFDYYLPPELIAQHPTPRREDSRLMTVNRATQQIDHTYFHQVPALLRPGDLLIINDSKVLPARLRGRRMPGGGAAELLLLRQLDGDRWLVLARPGRRIRAGDVLEFGEGELRARVNEVLDEGQRIVEFAATSGTVASAIELHGEVPLPPYIRESVADPSRYQTVYAREAGSAAAPTAGLHFSQDLLGQVAAAGVQIAPITLHVGLGTFRPVQAARVEEHHMHAEYALLPEATARAMQETRATGGRIVAVGTTSVRVLESAALHGSGGWSGWTDIFIYPGFEFRNVDALITNFHLPRSSLLMLVSAFAGRELILECYKRAVAERYRFFSFGDAMFIA